MKEGHGAWYDGVDPWRQLPSFISDNSPDPPFLLGYLLAEIFSRPLLIEMRVGGRVRLATRPQPRVILNAGESAPAPVSYFLDPILVNPFFPLTDFIRTRELKLISL